MMLPMQAECLPSGQYKPPIARPNWRNLRFPQDSCDGDLSAIDSMTMSAPSPE
jgi:hypothetical protein